MQLAGRQQEKAHWTYAEERNEELMHRLVRTCVHHNAKRNEQKIQSVKKNCSPISSCNKIQYMLPDGNANSE